MTKPLRLARIVTAAFTFETLLHDQIAAIRDAGIEITLIAGDVQNLQKVAQDLEVFHHWIPMSRQPSIGQDIRSLVLLTSFFRRQRFNVIHSSTPKAGLLTALAGPVGNSPVRMHTFTGQRWATLKGLKRSALRNIDRLIAFSSTITYADSASQRGFLIRERIVRAGKNHVLGAGSISGVNLDRFDPGRWRGVERAATRARLGIAPEAEVLVFVGRLTRDKGIVELVESFITLLAGHPGLVLLIVGPFEPGDPIPAETRAVIEGHPSIRITGFSSTQEQYLGVSDIFCLPSYREGFGSVVIEAGAMGLPSVATRISGLVDAVVDGVTGVLVEPRDAVQLTSALNHLLAQPALRQKMGTAARERAVRDFDSRLVNKLVVDEYFRHWRH